MESFTKAIQIIQSRAKKAVIYAWNVIASNNLHTNKQFVAGDVKPEESSENLLLLMNQCCDLNIKESSRRRSTAVLGGIYLNLSLRERLDFLILLSNEFSIKKTKMIDFFEEYLKGNHSPQKEVNFYKNLQSPRMILLRQFTSIDSNGLKFIVDMRSDVLSFLKKGHNELSVLENDLRYILSAWFDIGLLDLRRITWDSSASLLEKLIAYEAVHEIHSWDDLRNRLDSDRLCFAFFHHNIRNEPLIFVEVALSDRVSSNISELLDESLPLMNVECVNTAIFYSISNTQKGLSGINMGGFLIKKVVDYISCKHPRINCFVTLSPVPGFLKWLNGLKESNSLSSELNEVLGNPFLIENCSEIVKDKLLYFCAVYLTSVECGKTIDPVANFHLSNGASLISINWKADMSEKGIKTALGFMVNYHYNMDEIELNSNEYFTSGKINFSKAIKKILNIYH